MFTVWPDLHPLGPQCEGGPSPLTVALPPGADQWSRCKRRLHSLAHTHCGALRALHRCAAAGETRWIYSCTRYMGNTLLLCFKVSSRTHVAAKRFRPKRAVFAFVARAFVTGIIACRGNCAIVRFVFIDSHYGPSREIFCSVCLGIFSMRRCTKIFRDCYWFHGTFLHFGCICDLFAFYLTNQMHQNCFSE